jgi:hypothetical protein
MPSSSMELWVKTLGIGVQRLCKIAIVGINLAQSALCADQICQLVATSTETQITNNRLVASCASRLAARTLHTPSRLVTLALLLFFRHHT